MPQKKFEVSAKFYDLSTGKVTCAPVQANLPTSCPRCNRALLPEVLTSVVLEETKSLYVTCYCASCGECFFAICKLPMITLYDNTYDLVAIMPRVFHRIDVPDTIQQISPSFSEVYNQACRAESLEMDKICGMAYRKALEILVRDFCKEIHPDATESIDNTVNLGTVINNFLGDYPVIQELSKAASILGNDEAHAKRYSTEYPQEDLGAFFEPMFVLTDQNALTQRAKEIIQKNNQLRKINK